MLRRSRLLSLITTVCTTLTVSSAVASFGRSDCPSSSTLPLRLLNTAAHFTTVLQSRRLLPNGFHEVFMHFFERHSFLTEELDYSSDFKILHFANVSHILPSLRKQPRISQSKCPSIRSNYRLKNILIQWILPKHIGLITFWSHHARDSYCFSYMLYILCLSSSKLEKARAFIRRFGGFGNNFIIGKKIDLISVWKKAMPWNGYLSPKWSSMLFFFEVCTFSLVLNMIFTLMLKEW